LTIKELLGLPSNGKAAIRVPYVVMLMVMVWKYGDIEGTDLLAVCSTMVDEFVRGGAGSTNH